MIDGRRKALELWPFVFRGSYNLVRRKLVAYRISSMVSLKNTKNARRQRRQSFRDVAILQGHGRLPAFERFLKRLQQPDFRRCPTARAGIVHETGLPDDSPIV